ncbi:MAG: hypothetical protein ACRDPI_02080, partial [Nocardioidaceae bacterium]
IHDSNVVGEEWIHIPALGGLLIRLHNPVTILLVFLALGVPGSKTTSAKRSEPEDSRAVSHAG